MVKHWVRFRSAAGPTQFGVLAAGRIAVHEGDMFGAASATGESVAADAVALLAPCVPGKIVALWNNFHALCAKQAKPPPAGPRFLLKSAGSVIGPGDDIRRPGTVPGRIAFEGELGIVIGRRCKEVPIGDVARHVFGYTCVNDVTAIDVLTEDADFAQWSRSKSYDTFGCLGPAIAAGFDPAPAHVVTTLDGVERQNYPVADMVFAPDVLVSRISHDLTLLPGDVIACGTSVGVGSIKDGSVVRITIDGIGTLENRLR